MADDPQMIREHQDFWHGFVKFTTWSVAAIVVTLVLMAVFLL